MASLLLSSRAIEDQYKEVSQVINSTEINKKDIRKKGMKALMRESFFHGASWIGYNFIA